MVFKDITEAREFFKGDKFASNTGIELDELGEDYAIASLNLTDAHKNAYGNIMGGVIFTLADFTFAVLSNHLHKPTVGQQVSINYLSSAKGDKLIAKAGIKKNGRTSSIITVDIEDNTGRNIAFFTGTGFKL